MKTCIKCKEEKCLDKFSKDKHTPDGIRRTCKQCQSEYRKNYYSKNRERELIQNASWHELHAEELKEYREGRKAASAAISKSWSENNPDKNREKARRWKKNHPEKNREKNQRRNALKRSVTVNIVDYEKIRERDKSICYMCGILSVDRIDPKKYQPDEIHFEHVVALVNGGSHSEDNIKVSCGECNLRKGYIRG